jgi:CDP-diacylglycerol---serine O-phosphatidyltransferase
MRRPRLPRPSMVMLPNGFTLANLFFGVFAIITAARGDHERAVWYIIVGAICDAIDGRVARATGTGSRFGEELDSLVDAISFGFAPALMMYFAVLRKDGLDWFFVFLFSACAVMRLARFNVEQAGRKKTHFRGLPSPVAGGTLATYYWFSQTPLYNETVISDLPWHTMVRFLMAGLAFLMISNVPYPAMPTFSAKTLRGVFGLVAFIGLIFGLIFLPKDFFFPVGMLYVIYGIVASVVKGLLDTDRTPIEETTA